MGRTSKFSFPVPGRRRNSTRSSNSDAQPAPTAAANGSGLSKAQRLLGTDGSLNIDAPPRDDDGRSYKSTTPSASGMSIAISESTRNDDAFSSGWDGESAVLPRHELYGKASSTLLGHRFQDRPATDNSSLGSRLRMQNSNATMRSHYDRQKSPLSVSQQTSASSARDLALRKGFPPVTTAFPRTPLLDVEYIQQDGEMYSLQPDSHDDFFQATESHSKKKPTRLDLSRLFSRSRKDDKGLLSSGEANTESPSASSRFSGSGHNDETKGRRKLTKAPSRESMGRAASQSGNQVENFRPPPPQVRGSNHDTLHNLYEEYESLNQDQSVPPPIPRGRIDDRGLHQIPKEEAVEVHMKPRARPHEFQRQEVLEEHIRNTRPSQVPAPWDKQSTTSSKRTANSVFSDSDLRKDSVLSLSSDEEDEEIDKHAAPAPAPRKDVKKRDSSSTQDSRNTNRSKNRPSAKVTTKVTTKIMQDGNFLTIPETSAGKVRLSEAQTQKKPEAKRTSRQSTSSRHIPTIQQPSPPPSPGSIKSQATVQSSRFMVVSKQEEALLEALRQKRARMREKIIKEHETKSNKMTSLTPAPPAVKADKERHSHKPDRRTSTTSKDELERKAARDSDMTIRVFRESDLINQRDKQSEQVTEQILQFPTRSNIEHREVDAAEPSPDLSDFLSFGSDEDDDLTPRTSWIVSKDQIAGRPDPLIDPSFADRDGPKTPRSAARLSAVGMLRGFPKPARGKGRTGQMGYLDDVTGAMDEGYDNEHDPVWGL